MPKDYRLTPEGTADTLFDECAEQKKITGELEKLFEAEGYRQVRTPGLEFLDVFASNADYYPKEAMFKFSDSKGRLVAMRPDNTVPIVRMTATKLKGASLPIKLYYIQEVFRRQQEHRGRSTEILQAGIELIGDTGFESDIAVLELAIKSLSAVYPGKFRIEIGHVGIFKRLLERLGAGEKDRDNIHSYITAKNNSALYDILEGYEENETRGLLKKVPRLFGGTEALDEAIVRFDGYDPEINAMLEYLKKVLEALEDRGYGGKVMVDLGLVNQADYYSSIVFRAYGEGAGRPLLSGGRYDDFFSNFDTDLPAIGFGLDVDIVTEARLEARDAEVCEVRGAGSLRIALTKGRVERDFTKLLEKAGYDITPFAEKGRKLLFMVPGADIEIFLAKAPDVITYVEHGACDVGIVGKDTIAEAGGTYYEILDLGIGKCKFALAAPEGRRIFGGIGTRTIATKYPNVAERYFEAKGMDVDIIKIEGSVEIAPLLALADGIVDIVETGNTLKENGLSIIEDIRQISSRLIVNNSSMKLRKKEIEGFVKKLEGVL
ncbi:MAG: ATP phosphoribosyltransferase regulatory subunit [Clostridiales Family XIII bacterium]|nr:ATP phosphoribosyltransferase regulatory subunit [Clostridiales Family XIII bacterium]